MAGVRVVVTGMGALSPLGEAEAFWEGLLAGRSGVRAITRCETSALQAPVAGEVDFDPARHAIPPKQARRASRASLLAQAAAAMALADAGLEPADVRAGAGRCGVAVGTANAGFELLLDSALARRLEGARPQPLALVNGLPNMPAHYVSAYSGAAGPFLTLSATCASGTQAIAAALDQMRLGRADLMLAGGVDTLIHTDVLLAFEAMTALARAYDGDPTRVARPFDAARDGFVMGEGCGMLVLETLAHARARGARIRAELLGGASSSDAYHSAAPDEEGRGAAEAMRWALADAGLAPGAIGYVNAHGTGTRANDPMETRAIKAVFGARAYQIPISATKSMTGHCMGGSGALEAIACVRSLETGRVHPTVNLEHPDPECDLDYVAGGARAVELEAALSNSFGLGGQNACLVLGAWREGSS